MTRRVQRRDVATADVCVQRARGVWLALCLVLLACTTLAGCIGPGLDPPGDEGQSRGGSGGSLGAGAGTAGSGGAAGGAAAGMSGSAGSGGHPVTDMDAGAADGGVELDAGSEDDGGALHP